MIFIAIAVWLSLSVANFIFQYLFTATPDFRVAIERSYFQGAALLAVMMIRSRFAQHPIQLNGRWI